MVSCPASLSVKIQACQAPLAGENSHFFTWLFTKMAVSVVGGWESGKEVTGSCQCLVPKNACICLITSFSWVGNNPSLQIHSYCENRAKCYWTCDPNEEVFSSVLTRQDSDLLVADSSYQRWYEACKRSLSLGLYLLLMPCWEGEPKQQQFFAEMFIKRWFCSKKMCLHCWMMSVYWLKFMI